MRTVLDAAKTFGRFWYHFVVGDDWTIAVGVAVALGGTYGLLRTNDVPAWLVLPLAAVVIVAASVVRANRREARAGR